MAELMTEVERRTEMHDDLVAALSLIARGRTDGGRPLSGEAARQLARRTLTAAGIDWSA